MKRLLAILMALSLTFSLCACDFAKDVVDSAKNTTAKDKTFDLGDVSIELTTDFLRMDFISEDYDFIVGDEELTIMGMEIEHEDNALADLTVLEFAEFFRSNMEESDPTEITEIDGIPTMQYAETDDEGVEKTVAVMCYKSDESFWVILFVADADKFDKMYDDICKYAKTVEVE